MKKNPATLGLIISVAIALLAFGVYSIFLSKKNYHLVDNPTPDTYYFKINNEEQKILGAGQFLKINIHKGQNKISVFDAEKKLIYDTIFNVKKERGLINLTKKDYYIHTQYYGYQLNKDSLLLRQGFTEIDGKKYYGGPKKTTALYIDDFYYNIDEEYDAIIKNIQKVESRTKIFRKQDFINYHNEYYNK
ncbi:hypothetical protein [Bergeyella zoohelcum]|uniref:Uncharacterized protein n=1 Tax=Bergeyella zoohelcum TaxID=1015 RepID=A0A7Z9CG48_9FLAO|nr:hypothetical protein [Bergeyella zoohelcum]VDH02751.1 Uncharacterised protein [Bergeyella zoohelcum]